MSANVHVVGLSRLKQGFDSPRERQKTYAMPSPRKLIAFHHEDKRALDELADDRSTTFQELIDEAVRDFLVKQGKYTDLKTALRKSVQSKKPSPERR